MAASRTGHIYSLYIFILYLGLCIVVNCNPVSAGINLTPCRMHNVTELDCSNLALTSIPANLSTDLEILNLHGNNITVIEDGDFKDLQNLKHLDLSNNYIIDVESGAFTGLDKLQTLLLAENLISDVREQALEKIPSLQHLELQHNSLYTIPKALTPLKKLEVLDLSNNLLHSVNFNQSFRNLSSLKVLNLGGNQIRAIHDFNFAGLNGTELDRLVLAHNILQVIKQESFLYFSSISYLDLTGTLITPTYMGEVLYGLQNVRLHTLCLREMNWKQIDDGTFQALSDTTIKTLDLSSNLLSELTTNIFPLASLRALDLANNKLELIEPEVLTSLRHLKSLNLTGNELKDYPVLSSVKNTLLDLSLSDNQLRGEIPHGAFTGLTKLTSLDLSMNQISGTLQPGIFGGQAMTLNGLNISHNHISNISREVFYNTTVLKTLDLSYNSLKSVQGDMPFRHLYECIHLDLSYNNISNIVSNAFTGMVALENLNLGYNFLSNGSLFTHNSTVFLPVRDTLTKLVLAGNSLHTIHQGTFQMLSKLVNLDLSDNNIENLGQGLFRDLIQLKMIDLHLNLIQTVNRSTFIGLNSLEVLNMEENPFSCTCDLEWFRYWLENTNVTVVGSDEYICAFPENGDLVMDFDPDISCNKGPAQILSLCLVGLTILCIVIMIICRTLKGCKAKKRLHRYAAVPHKTSSWMPRENSNYLVTDGNLNHMMDNNSINISTSSTVPLKPLPHRKMYPRSDGHKHNSYLETPESSENETETKFDGQFLKAESPTFMNDENFRSGLDDQENMQTLTTFQDPRHLEESDSNSSSSQSSRSSQKESNRENQATGDKLNKQKSGSDVSNKSSNRDNMDGEDDKVFDQENINEETKLLEDGDQSNDTKPAIQTPIDPSKITQFRPVKYSV
ncbi:CD180 antigen-like [Glandiceps talaboti]